MEASCRVESAVDAVFINLLAKSINSAKQVECIQKAVTAEINKGTQRLIFDFDGVEFVSSSVIGLLAETRQQLGSPRGQRPRYVDVFPDKNSAAVAVMDDDGDAIVVALCSLAPQIEEVFKICGLIK